MKFVVLVSILFVATMVTLHLLLQNGTVVRYLDSHPNPSTVPAVEYYIGGGYYIMGHLESSATYYQRIFQRYPKSSYADDAYFSYLECLDDMNTSRLAMAEAYSTYLERFPNGNHVDMARKRVEYRRNNVR